MLIVHLTFVYRISKLGLLPGMHREVNSEPYGSVPWFQEIAP